MTDTTVKSKCWRRMAQHFNKTVAEVMANNIKTVGLPVWDEADQTGESDSEGTWSAATGLEHQDRSFRGRRKPEDNRRRSDDIGDVSWNAPTVTLRYPRTCPDCPGTIGRTRLPVRHLATRAPRPAQR